MVQKQQHKQKFCKIRIRVGPGGRKSGTCGDEKKGKTVTNEKELKTTK